MAKNKSYTAAEKYRIALEAIKGDLTQSQITSKYQVHPTQINKWKKQALEYLQAAFSNKLEVNKLTEQHEDELSELYKQVGKLKVENEFLKKNLLSLPNDHKALLDVKHPLLSLRQQCSLFGINRSSYYYKPEPIDGNTLQLMHAVDEIYTKYPFFGSRQMVNYLRSQGINVGRDKIRSIYEKLGLRATCPGPHTSTPHPEHKIYPYLLRNMHIVACDHVWSTDITYIRLHNGFVYLMAIIDWFSRYVLDWELSISLDTDFCVAALERVLEKRQCCIFNTDQGAQFTSTKFTSVLLKHGISISMDGKGRAIDNVFAERLWRSVKYECVYLHDFYNVKELRKMLINYFNFYNTERPHQGLNGLTPIEVYNNGSVYDSSKRMDKIAGQNMENINVFHDFAHKLTHTSHTDILI